MRGSFGAGAIGDAAECVFTLGFSCGDDEKEERHVDDAIHVARFHLPSQLVNKTTSPQLATKIGSVLFLNAGDGAEGRANLRTVEPGAVDENYTVRHVGGSPGDETIEVLAFGQSQRFTGITRVVGYMGSGADTVSVGQSVTSEIELRGGSGNDVFTLAAEALHSLTISGASGGTFRLTVGGSGTTGALAHDASAADLQAALETLLGVGSVARAVRHAARAVRPRARRHDGRRLGADGLRRVGDRPRDERRSAALRRVRGADDPHRGERPHRRRLPARGDDHDRRWRRGRGCRAAHGGGERGCRRRGRAFHVRAFRGRAFRGRAHDFRFAARRAGRSTHDRAAARVVHDGQGSGTVIRHPRSRLQRQPHAHHLAARRARPLPDHHTTGKGRRAAVLARGTVTIAADGRVAIRLTRRAKRVLARAGRPTVSLTPQGAAVGQRLTVRR